ncbi:unnamed protein product [Anisakis simplex]|uniref:DNA-directed RNA polymerase n=1 Tax=Anisakis simplex TaxID=6269 RepID=A0A0M3KHG2_ANISI|nr:unnamed protein product [Anisakis simplex]
MLDVMSGTHLVNESLLIEINEFLSSAFLSSNDSSSLLMSIRKYTLPLENLLKCFLLDRIVIVANETEMVDRAKIRHPPDFVDGTSGRMDGARHPVSRDNTFVDLKYLTYGFSFLQDAVERALIELATGQRVKTGLFAQQEPYPCTGYDR